MHSVIQFCNAVFLASLLVFSFVYNARGPTPAEIPYTLVEIRGRNLEMLVFENLIFPLNLAYIGIKYIAVSSSK